MVTGDRADVAEIVGAVIGVDEVLAERTPAEKVDAVRAAASTARRSWSATASTTPPPWRCADVGVAVGARGATASSEAADVVLTVDRLDRLGRAIAIAQRSAGSPGRACRPAWACHWPRWSLAAFGLLPPAWGRCLQEAIDVAVILNALRALTPGRRHA